MESKTAILAKLLESSPVTLEQLCADTGISAQNVERALGCFEKDGFQIESVPHVGISIKTIPDHIVDYNLNRMVKGTVFENRVYCFDKVTSTNDVAANLVKKLGIAPLVVCARTQTNGKGRQGRHWFSPNDAGLWFSVAIHPDLRPEHISQLTFLAAVCTAEELKKVSPLSIKVKWPNDILAAGKKCGGILTELKTGANTKDLAIVGIGINFDVDPKTLKDQDLPEATSLKAQTKTTKTELLANLLKSFSGYLEMLNKGNFEFIQKQWEQWADITGKNIRVTHGPQTFSGTVKGLAPTGALLVATADEQVKQAISVDTVTIL